MQYLDKLKKERSIDRVIFLAGMVLAFIGFIIPTIYVKQIVTTVDLTSAEDALALAESADYSDEPEEFDSEDSDSYEYVAEDDESDEYDVDEDYADSSLAFAYEDEEDDFDYDDTEYAFVSYASKKEITREYKKLYKKDPYGNYEKDSDGELKYEFALDKNGNKIPVTNITYKYVVVDAEIDDDENFILGEDGKPKYMYVLDFDKDGNKLPDDEFVRVPASELESNYTIEKNAFNLFGAVEVLNQGGLDYENILFENHVPGTAYNATFIVIVWLCTIAGIVLFFLTKTIIGDVIVVLLAIAFGLASMFCVPITLNVPFITGSFFVGAYVSAIGIIIALAGTLLGAAHIQHPSQVKSAE